MQILFSMRYPGIQWFISGSYLRNQELIAHCDEGRLIAYVFHTDVIYQAVFHWRMMISVNIVWYQT